MIIAGPCLLNDNQAEIDNCIETAMQLYAIDPAIMFRCKLFGGGTTPERYKPGIEFKGIEVFKKLWSELKGINLGTEIQTLQHLYLGLEALDFFWIGARNCQNYGLLSELGAYINNRIALIKRGAAITIDELIGIHDICRDIHGYKPIMIERGINTFCRTPDKRWTVDYDGMMRLLRERPDIGLMLDPSHASGSKEYIFPMVKAACAIGVKNFMLEVYANPELTQTDKAQAISIEEFKPIYEYIKKHEGE
jgi:3-deoxy-7-phosphoheptulonate synthase